MNCIIHASNRCIYIYYGFKIEFTEGCVSRSSDGPLTENEEGAVGRLPSVLEFS